MKRTGDSRTLRWPRLGLLVWVLLGLRLVPARAGEAPPPWSETHATNRDKAAELHEANRRRYTHDPGVLVLPGLVADRNANRVEVRVERTRLGPEEPCEFMVIAEASDHSYEALLVAFAKPSDVHRAIEFIGLVPGAPWNPGANRFWARGERVLLSLVGSGGRRIRLEPLLLDRRSGRPLREEGFVFTGSLTVPAPNDSRAREYAADAYQPKAIVSLFNSAHCVLQVPYPAPKDEVYQNTVVNPEHPFPEGELLSLIIEPARPDGSPRVKDLALRVGPVHGPPGKPLEGVARLNALHLELKGGGTVLNESPTLLAVLGEMARLDRVQHDWFLTVTFADEVELGDAQALARILSTIDSERGVRIEPPLAGDLYYRAFTPDPGLVDRTARLYHPWELSVSEKDGRVAGRLLRIDPVGANGGTNSGVAVTEIPVSGPEELRRALDAEAQRTRAAGIRARPPVLLVFAPPALRYGALRKFIAPALPTHPAVHVYLECGPDGVPRRSLEDERRGAGQEDGENR